MLAILSAFERDFEPLIPPGNHEAITKFKELVRKKINGLAYEGTRALESSPADLVSPLAADLAEDLAAFETDRED